MRVYNRESIAEVKVPVADSRERLIEIQAIIDLTGRMKVNRLNDGPAPQPNLSKPKGVRFAILSAPKGR